VTARFGYGQQIDMGIQGSDGTDRLRTATAVAHRRDPSNDFGCELYDGGSRDEKAIRRAAPVTLRRAICERFPTEC